MLLPNRVSGTFQFWNITNKAIIFILIVSIAEMIANSEFKMLKSETIVLDNVINLFKY